MTTYIAYSGPTEETGSRLAEALGVEHGRDMKGEVDIFIGWGYKTKKDITINAKTVLNHPNKIRSNRNKLVALQCMGAKDVTVEPFVAEPDVMTALRDPKSDIKLPLIARTNFHQGGKGFWLCPTLTTVAAARRVGAQYFQNMGDFETEYRVHVAFGSVVHVQKKVEAAKDRKEMGQRYAEQQFEKVRHIAERQGKTLDEADIKWVLERVQQPETPDVNVKSNTKGWKFSNVNKYPKDIVVQAVEAVAALGLDFGAVDVGVYNDETKKARKAAVIEVNTGPGLTGTPFDAYVKAFKKKLEELKKPKEKKEPEAKTEKVVVAKPSVKDGPSPNKASALLKALMAKATQEEANAIEAVLTRVLEEQ